MNNNDVLRRLRYTFDYDDAKMIALFESAEYPATREQISNWMKRDDDPDFQKLRDVWLAAFLNGLINELRGKKEGEQPKPEQNLNNNMIFRKLKIALNLQADDTLEILASEKIQLSKHELSAFFRKPEHKHYRNCKDQVLRNFLAGIQRRYRKSVWDR